VRSPSSSPVSPLPAFLSLTLWRGSVILRQSSHAHSPLRHSGLAGEPGGPSRRTVTATAYRHRGGGVPRLPPRGLAAATHGERVSRPKPRPEANRPLRTRSLARPPPLLPPLERVRAERAPARARARERAPPSSSRVLRQPRESKTHGYRVPRVENPRVCPTRDRPPVQRRLSATVIGDDKTVNATTFRARFRCRSGFPASSIGCCPQVPLPKLSRRNPLSLARGTERTQLVAQLVKDPWRSDRRG